MTGDVPVRRMAAAAVLLVAAIAAVISYVHIERLAVTHGQTALAAYLLPLSIDGTVAAASLAMLRAARAGLGTPRLARFMLGLAVAATLAVQRRLRRAVRDHRLAAVRLARGRVHRLGRARHRRWPGAPARPRLYPPPYPCVHPHPCLHPR